MTVVQKTTDYEKFKFIDGNRKLYLGHLARLAMSIAKRNMLEQNPIMVNENMEVIDGQHRLEVARQNKLAIFYVITPDTGIEEVLDLNNNVRNWKLPDYINSLVVRGNREMKYLKEFCEEYDLAPSPGMILHTGTSWHGDGNPSARLARLEFSENQRKIAADAADLLSTIREYKTKKGAVPHAMLFAVRKIAQEGLAGKVGNAIRERGKVVAMSLDRAEGYRVLESYMKK